MPAEHKAYVFDWSAFDAELGIVLYAALETGDCTELAAFIDAERNRLTDPNEGDPLPDDWRALVYTWDAHQLGDFAMTAYYRVRGAEGLGYAWAEVYDRATPTLLSAVLGAPFGPPSTPFDPGKYGSYFQTPQGVQQSRVALEAFDWPELTRYRSLLTDAAREGVGVYVTF
jgi:hypothetical protein